MKTKLLLIGLVTVLAPLCTHAQSQRETYPLNKGWKFHYGDVPLVNGERIAQNKIGD